jgi:hypothetical protein
MSGVPNERLRDILKRVDEDARGTRCLTMAEVTICIDELRRLAALASQEPPAMHELPMYKGRFRCKQHNTEQGRCTLPEGHEGQHLAETGTAMWDAESVPAPSVTRPTPATVFRTEIVGIGPWCVEFPDGEIITTRSEERARQIAAQPVSQDTVLRRSNSKGGQHDS